MFLFCFTLRERKIIEQSKTKQHTSPSPRSLVFPMSVEW